MNSGHGQHWHDGFLPHWHIGAPWFWVIVVALAVGFYVFRKQRNQKLDKRKGKKNG